MAKKPVLPLARLAEAKVIKGKGKTKGKGQFPLWAKAKAKAKAMAKQKVKARDYSLASPSSHDKDSVASLGPLACNPKPWQQRSVFWRWFGILGRSFLPATSIRSTRKSDLIADVAGEGDTLANRQRICGQI